MRFVSVVKTLKSDPNRVDEFTAAVDGGLWTWVPGNRFHLITRQKIFEPLKILVKFDGKITLPSDLLALLSTNTYLYIQENGR